MLEIKLERCVVYNIITDNIIIMHYRKYQNMRAYCKLPKEVLMRRNLQQALLPGNIEVFTHSPPLHLPPFLSI